MKRPASTLNNLPAAGGAVHMTGIGGVGMAGLALLLKARGWRVSGSDSQEGNALCQHLRSQGIPVWAGHAASYLNDSGAEWLIHTSAVSEDNVEVAAARSAGLSVWRRGEALASLIARDQAQTIAVAGTHGKTTTSTMIAQLLQAVGRDPSWCIGGSSSSLDAVAGVGEGPELVVEADESDGTLALYSVDMAVVTNIEFDHMEHFASVEAFEACFATFMQATRRRVVYCADDERARRLGRSLPNGLACGMTDEADVQGVVSERGDLLHLSREGQTIGTLPLVLPGAHNAINLLMAASVCLELGVDMAALERAAISLTLPRRRFETVCEEGGIHVISDYAHHPTEIAALVRTARQTHQGRLLAVFQPHRYTRTAALGPLFPAAFAGLDWLVLAPVYAASELPIAGGLERDLYEHFRVCGEASVPLPLLATSLEQAWHYVRSELQTGDCLLVVGAGDVENLAMWAHDSLVEKRASKARTRQETLKERCPAQEPAAINSHDAPREGVCVEGWDKAEVEVNAEDVWRYCQKKALPVRWLGADKTLLISDLGVGGMVIRVTGVAFADIPVAVESVEDPVSVPLVRLQEAESGSRLTELAFVEDSFACSDGRLRANGQAYGHTTSERILWIRGLNRAGEPCIVQADVLAWGTGCTCLRELIVLQAGFRMLPVCPADVKGGRCTILGQGARTQRGNLVVEKPETCGPDVFALIQRIENAVCCGKKFELVRENEGLE